jgi:hypothetical protein
MSYPTWFDDSQDSENRAFLSGLYKLTDDTPSIVET